MKWSMATVGLIILGLIGISVVVLFQNLTVSSENDYYLLKEITEASMFDAIDISYYRDTGDVKIVREKFVENFIRRYAESTLFVGGRYIISFFDIMEEPPKVSLLINTDIVDYSIFGDSSKSDYSVFNNLTGIFEYTTNKNKESDAYVKKTYMKTYHSMPATDNYTGNYVVVQPFNIPLEISQKKIKPGSIKITFNNIRASNNLEDILYAKLMREIDWAKVDGEHKTKYYELVDLEKYASHCDVEEIHFYDCKNENNGIGHGDNGEKNYRMDCSNYNTFWIYWSGKCDGSGEVLLMIDANFEYEEYEY